jgi:hypothetical protein
MLFKEIIAAFMRNIPNINTSLRAKSRESFLNVKSGGTYGRNCA